MPTTEGEQVDNAVQREELERSLHKIVNAHGTRSFHYRQSTPMMNELVKFVEAYTAEQVRLARVDTLERLPITHHKCNLRSVVNERLLQLKGGHDPYATLTPQSDTKDGYKPFPTREDVGQTFRASKMKKGSRGNRFNGKHND